MISDKDIQQHIDALAQIGNLGSSLEEGFLRAGWSAEESRAFDYIRGYAERFGFCAEYDAVGNMFLTLGPETAPVLQIGSHLDTVVRGGLFDGAAGIIAGLEVFTKLSTGISTLNRRLQLVVWRGEESATYVTAYKGSKAAFGMLEPRFLDARFRGLRLEDAIRQSGFDPEPIRREEATISQERIDEIEAHFELHIEQGRVLEMERLDLGIATSIRAPHRSWIFFHGRSDHSGATPLGVPHRRDANLAMAHAQVRLDALAQGFLANGVDITQTFGVVNADSELNSKHPELFESGITKIAQFGYFSLDFRSNSAAVLEEYIKKVDELLSQLAAEFDVEISREFLGSARPLEQLDQALQQSIEESAKALELRCTRMPCGAGHDVQILAQQRKSDGSLIPCALLLIPCREGISHDPKEFAETSAITKGANTLLRCIGTLLEQ